MSERSLSYRLFFGHFIFSLVLNTYQPLLPVLQRELGISLVQSSILPTTITLMVMLSNLAVGVLIARLGRKFVFNASVLLASLGAALIGFAPGYVFLLSGYALIGLATGGAFTSMTTIFAGLQEKYRNFGLFHAFFGIGGMVAPMVLGVWISGGLEYRYLFLIFAGLQLAFFLMNALSKSMVEVRYRNFTLGQMFRAAASPVMLLGVGVLGSYAAVEIGATTWSSNMSADVYSMNTIGVSAILSGFWAAFTLGRLISDPVARKMGEMFYIRISMGLALVMALLWILGFGAFWFIPIGFFLGPVFPVVQKYINHHLPEEQRGLFNGMSYAMTSLFASVFLPVMGVLGDVRMEFAFLPTVVLIILFLVTASLLRRKMGS